MEVYIARDGSYFGAEARNLIREHAGGGDLDGIVPVVVVVTEGVGEVEDGHLWNLWGVLGHIEMCGFNWTLSHRVWHEEEIELAFNDFRLLNEASINIGALRRVVDEVPAVVALRLLEESLAHALINDDQSDLG